MSEDRAVLPDEMMEASLTAAQSRAPSTRPSEITGRINAFGDVELPEMTNEGRGNEREPIQPKEDETAAAGPEQQIIEGAATLFGLNGASGDGSGGGRGKGSGGIAANIIRSVISAPFYPLKFVHVRITNHFSGRPHTSGAHTCTPPDP